MDYISKKRPIYFMTFILRSTTVKRTTPHPCIVLGECDQKIYTNFKFCEEENHRHFINILILSK